MCNKHKSGDASSFLHGVVFGATLGAVAGILLAPDKGTETKRKIEERVNPIINDIKPIVAALVEVSEPKRRELTNKISQIIEDTTSNT